MNTPVIRVAGCSHRYARFVALEGIDLEVRPASMVGVIGPDGVGKSTLLSLIAGVRKIQTGSVTVLDQDLNDVRQLYRLRRRIAYMPQGLGQNLYPALSVRENVDFFGRLFGLSSRQRTARIATLLELTGLASFAGRAAGKLSGGMRQKLGLCCSLIHNPELLILDEPTTGVDPLSRRQFWTLIDHLRGPGMSIVVATAYMEEAERFDSLVVMDGGRILATGSVAEIKARTGESDMEAAFIALLPEARRRDHRAPEVAPRCVLSDGPVIVARGLTRRFGDFTAVDEVSLRIERGEIFGFLGSNGCGKTTTMKMLTGLLPASAGEAELFGRPVDAADIATRRRVGFMSQSFSLYGELTVRQNLELHGHLFHLSTSKRAARISELVRSMELGAFMDSRAETLPLGVRQRLSLAVAVIHEPEVLILDEPTSGVDPVARDRFWELLIGLAREQGVTIFISTHFMHEAARCDRISLMHAGRVLAQGAPSELMRQRHANSLEDVFIANLCEAQKDLVAEGGVTVRSEREALADTAGEPTHSSQTGWFSLRRLAAYFRRESMEIRRDGIRLAFALLGPMILMLVMGYGICLDVENLPYAVMDYDQTPASRRYLEQLSGSRYFVEHPPSASGTEMLRRLRAGEIAFAVEIPPGFGRDLTRGRVPEVGITIDGAIPFRASTMRGYLEGIHQTYLDELARASSIPVRSAIPARVETRFHYNQEFKSVYALVPGVIAIMLAAIPAVLSAVSVVREKEMGTITNLYATPATRLEFLVGKQLPYVAIGMLNFLSLAAMAVVLFGVPLKGDFLTLLVGAVLFVFASTGWGLLISSFTRTQISALFATFLLTLIPAINFSGFLSPVSSQTGAAAVMGYGFPTTYFRTISTGVFTKGLGFAELHSQHLLLSLFVLGYGLFSLLLLKTRER